MNVKKIYLAGPMTGLPDLNYPAFHAEAARLRALGYEVVSPAELDHAADADWLDCMRTDIPHAILCDAAAVLPGFIDSRGCAVECTLMVGLGLPVYIAASLLTPNDLDERGRGVRIK